MPYQFATGSSGITSFPSLLTTQITVPKLVVKVLNLTPKGDDWVLAGYLQAVSQTNIGAVGGQVRKVFFKHKTEISLDIPAYPYQIQFIPKHYVTRWALEVWTKDRSGSDGTPSVPLTEAEATATGWVIW
jgi:hypothetical protein